jgi:hypothetical protein
MMQKDLNIIWCCQSESINLFNGLQQVVEKSLPVGKTAFLISDSEYYARWIDKNQDFESKGYDLVKEWEQASPIPRCVNYKKLALLEKEFGQVAGLFGAIVADRRLLLGPNCTYTQDYRRRFSDEELLSILTIQFDAVLEAFDRVKPDIVVSFVCTTIFDYIAYLIAKKRGIQYLNLRPTRISNQVAFFSTINDPAPEFRKYYVNVLNGLKHDFKEEATKFIEANTIAPSVYEGAISARNRPIHVGRLYRAKDFKKVARSLGYVVSYLFSPSARDNHVASPHKRKLFIHIINPVRARILGFVMRKNYIDIKQQTDQRFVFYPLHAEPEVSLLVYSRPLVNQIEIIRMIALSLPTDAYLLVKEHPWMIGKRKLSYYKKLMNIPKVRIVSPETTAREVIDCAVLTIVTAGSVGLEAILRRKPVITFGDCPFNVFPSEMVTRCRDLRTLPQVIKSSIEKYKFSMDAVEAYIQTVFAKSTPVNLYSTLLMKKHLEQSMLTTYDNELIKLANYFLRLIKEKPETEEDQERYTIW